jgi:hypothetical protein
MYQRTHRERVTQRRERENEFAGKECEVGEGEGEGNRIPVAQIGPK